MLTLSINDSIALISHLDELFCSFITIVFLILGVDEPGLEDDILSFCNKDVLNLLSHHGLHLLHKSARHHEMKLIHLVLWCPSLRLHSLDTNTITLFLDEPYIYKSSLVF